ncbi:insulin-degrading enzyme-like protein [Trifolium pratense]|uniref:Insulin-degrading enzyme-like protein n=1 Tax=Trifolium pratense TaxID=57577 RepID=A0A2K3MGS8_TRIPR|nr:insulin-degrading enzyme-like protein [Trifolium pratense]
MHKARSLEEESNRLWTEILEQRCNFDIETKKAEQLKTIEKNDVIEWCGKYLKESSSKCRRLKIRFWANNADTKVDDSESDHTTEMMYDDPETEVDCKEYFITTNMMSDDSKSEMDYTTKMMSDDSETEFYYTTELKDGDDSKSKIEEFKQGREFYQKYRAF